MRGGDHSSSPGLRGYLYRGATSRLCTPDTRLNETILKSLLFSYLPHPSAPRSTPHSGRALTPTGTCEPSPKSTPDLRGPHLFPASPSASQRACASKPTWVPAGLAAPRRLDTPPSVELASDWLPVACLAGLEPPAAAPLKALPVEWCATVSCSSPPPRALWNPRNPASMSQV